MQSENQNDSQVTTGTFSVKTNKIVVDAYIALAIGFAAGMPIVILAIVTGISQIGSTSPSSKVDILGSVSFGIIASVSAFVFHRWARSVRFAVWILLLAIALSVVVSFLVVTFVSWFTVSLSVNNPVVSFIYGQQITAMLRLISFMLFFGGITYLLVTLSSALRAGYTLSCLVVLSFFAGLGLVFVNNPGESSIFSEDSYELRSDIAKVEKSSFQVYAPAQDTGYSFVGISTSGAIGGSPFVGLSFQKGASKQLRITLEQQDFASANPYDLQPIEDNHGGAATELYGVRDKKSSGYTKVAIRKGDTYVAVGRYPTISVTEAKLILDSLEPVANNRINIPK